MSATQPVGGVMTSHEFVVNGWTKTLVSADPFCRLEASTSNRVDGVSRGERLGTNTRTYGQSRRVGRSASPSKSHTTFGRGVRRCVPLFWSKLLYGEVSGPGSSSRDARRSEEQGMATRSSLLGERQGWRDSSRGFTTAFWALLSLSGKKAQT